MIVTPIVGFCKCSMFCCALHSVHSSCAITLYIYRSLVLLQPRKTRPCLTERFLMGRKESNQTKNHHVVEERAGYFTLFVVLVSHD